MHFKPFFLLLEFDPTIVYSNLHSYNLLPLKPRSSSLCRYYSKKNPHTTQDRALHLMERKLFVNKKTSALYDVRFQENWNKVVNYFICWRSEATRLKGEEMIASSTDRQGEEMQLTKFTRLRREKKIRLQSRI